MALRRWIWAAAAAVLASGLGCATTPAENYDFPPPGAAHKTGPLGDKGGSIRGFLVDARDGDPIYGQLLVLCHVEDVIDGEFCPGESLKVVTDEGLFLFDGLALGIYRLEVPPYARYEAEPGVWTVTIADPAPVKIRLKTVRMDTWI